MNTKLIKATGPHNNLRNLTTVGYCIESPKDVLKYLLDKGYEIGGYRQAGMTRCIGEGVVIRGTDMEPLDFGLSIVAKVEDIPLKNFDLKIKPYTEDDLKWMFGYLGGNLKKYFIKKQQYISIFAIPEEYITDEQRIIKNAAREFVETIKGHPITLEYLISLSE